MKLAQALQERSDLNRKIEELRRRLGNCLLIQEGEEPPEQPEELIKELDDSTARLGQLIAAINITNCRTEAEGMTLTQIIARKDALHLQLSAYRDMVYTAGSAYQRARGAEIRIIPMVKASVLQKKADEISAEIRRLDGLLQQTNWTADLMG
ncbi:MAG: DIP1984 family protein [Oscillospiraceae bacterium]|nr:DIP1984 family protein [Oscillospiraceae bacterium]MBQ8978436.1 DIP1984 family protein [Oscillospiraceae bacterium]